MYTARISDTFDAVLSGLPTGLVGTLGVQILDSPAGTVISARTTTGITEIPAGSGIYTATLTAPASPGDYVVIWDNVTAFWGQPLRVLADSIALTVAPEIRPAIADVEALLRARTVEGGDETGAFSATTRPTAVQVEQLIDVAAGDIQSRVGVPIRSSLAGQARWLGTVHAARLIELAFFPEQTTDADSLYANLTALFDPAMAELIASARQPMTTALA